MTSAYDYTTETIWRNRDFVIIVYRPNEDMGPYFGLALTNNGIAYVRSDLPERVRLAVRGHELFHLTERRHWKSSILVQEIWANLAVLLRNPVGFVHFWWTTLTSVERCRFYWQRISGKKYSPPPFMQWPPVSKDATTVQTN